MATYFMFGIYSADAMDDISAARTKDAEKTIAGFGGKVTGMYALMGEEDLVLIVDFPDNSKAMQASVALSKLTGISFSTAPAVEVAEFDKLMAGV
ncbi:MAG: GYD domain-containing protein [Fidelibacterota bacterium]|nr:MAG: GYD domain-containing protein [Candidatus Neomarinimicrobiota bacterium]